MIDSNPSEIQDSATRGIQILNIFRQNIVLTKTIQITKSCLPSCHWC